MLEGQSFPQRASRLGNIRFVYLECCLGLRVYHRLPETSGRRQEDDNGAQHDRRGIPRQTQRSKAVVPIRNGTKFKG